MQTWTFFSIENLQISHLLTFIDIHESQMKAIFTEIY